MTGAQNSGHHLRTIVWFSCFIFFYDSEWHNLYSLICSKSFPHSSQSLRRRMDELSSAGLESITRVLSNPQKGISYLILQYFYLLCLHLSCRLLYQKNSYFTRHFFSSISTRILSTPIRMTAPTGILYSDFCQDNRNISLL